MSEWAVWYPIGDGQGVYSVTVPGTFEEVQEMVEDQSDVIAIVRPGIVPSEVTQFYDCGWIGDIA